MITLMLELTFFMLALNEAEGKDSCSNYIRHSFFLPHLISRFIGNMKIRRRGYMQTGFWKLNMGLLHL